MRSKKVMRQRNNKSNFMLSTCHRNTRVQVLKCMLSVGSDFTMLVLTIYICSFQTAYIQNSGLHLEPQHGSQLMPEFLSDSIRVS